MPTPAPSLYQPPSTMDICNQALARLGGEQLSSVEMPWDQTALGRLCLANFFLVLEVALADHDWSFALKRIQLAEKPAPPGGRTGQHRYGLPADCLRPVRLTGYEKPFDAGTYRVEGDDLLTDQAPAELIYVARVADPRHMPSTFRLALSWALAAVLAMAKNNDPRQQATCFQQYEKTLAEARARDLAGQRPLEPYSAWLEARGGPWEGV